MYPHVFEKDEIEYPACHPEGDIKLRGRSWLWVGSGTEKRRQHFLEFLSASYQEASLGRNCVPLVTATHFGHYFEATLHPR